MQSRVATILRYYLNPLQLETSRYIQSSFRIPRIIKTGIAMLSLGEHGGQLP